jgi:predicted phosphodiesterase
MWSLFSVFDNHSPIDIKLKKIEHPDKLFLSLFHGMTIGLKNESGFMFEHGKSLEMFDGSNAVLCGDVHLRQEQDYNGIKIVQPGSLIQQNFGETVNRGHGYLVWDLNDIEDITYEECDIQSEYGYYKFRINSLDDLENNVEEFVNF